MASLDEISQSDIDYLITETGFSTEAVQEALLANNHDVVQALASLTLEYFFGDGDTDEDDDVSPSEQESESSMDLDGESYYLTDSDFSIEDGAITLTVPETLPVPETPSKVETIPDVGEQTSCVICMDGFDGTRNTTLKCGHKFHTDCILENIATAPTNKHMCPLCRKDFCSEVNISEIKELQGQVRVLGNGVHDLLIESTTFKDGMLFFHDKYEEREGEILELERKNSICVSHRKTLENALKRTHAKLSQQIIEGGSHGKYKKCSICEQYGHNRGTCTYGNAMYKTDLTYNIKHPKEYRPSKDIIEDVTGNGYWSEQIKEHFEQPTVPIQRQFGEFSFVIV